MSSSSNRSPLSSDQTPEPVAFAAYIAAHTPRPSPPTHSSPARSAATIGKNDDSPLRLPTPPNEDAYPTSKRRRDLDYDAGPTIVHQEEPEKNAANCNTNLLIQRVAEQTAVQMKHLQEVLKEYAERTKELGECVKALQREEKSHEECGLGVKVFRFHVPEEEKETPSSKWSLKTIALLASGGILMTTGFVLIGRHFARKA